MEGIVDTVVLVAISVVGAALARRLGFVAPLVLLVAGLGLSFVPGIPEIHIEPELVLIGILPPLLYVAALQTSVPAFRRALRPILLLAIGLVVVTSLVVGFALHAVLPEVPLSACIALGAVVAPPDAVSATAIARRIGLPRRVVTILEGESLLNDASALVLVRVAAAALTGTAVGFWDITGRVVLTAGGGLLIGMAAAVLAAWLHKKILDPLLDDAVSLLTPFVVVIIAEELHTSSVVAVVVAGLYLGHRIPYLLSPTSRLQMEAVWRLIIFLLEGIVFLLVGLQLRDLVGDLETGLVTTVQVTAVVFVTIVVVRFVWMYPATYLARLVPRIRAREERPPLAVPTVIAWAGMRGVVTLAAALTLPPVAEGGRWLPPGPVHLRRVRDHRADPADPGHHAAVAGPAPRCQGGHQRRGRAGRGGGAAGGQPGGAAGAGGQRRRRAGLGGGTAACHRGEPQQQRVGAAGQSTAGNPVRGVRPAAVAR